MPTPTTDPIGYSGFSGRAARDRIGEHAAVVLDPEENCCWVYTGIGSGVPMKVWHGRCWTFGVRSDASLDQVEEVIRANEALVERIFAAYRGKVWDGNNHVGDWGDSVDQVTLLVEQLSYECCGVSSYWEAWDYLHVASDDIAQDVAGFVRTGMTPEDAILEVADLETGRAAQEQALIDLDDAAGAVRSFYCESVERMLERVLGQASLPSRHNRAPGDFVAWMTEYGVAADVVMAAFCLDGRAANEAMLEAEANNEEEVA